jgi:hypothetical protein
LIVRRRDRYLLDLDAIEERLAAQRCGGQVRFCHDLGGVAPRFNLPEQHAVLGLAATNHRQVHRSAIVERDRQDRGLAVRLVPGTRVAIHHDGGDELGIAGRGERGVRKAAGSAASRANAAKVHAAATGEQEKGWQKNRRDQGSGIRKARPARSPIPDP